MDLPGSVIQLTFRCSMWRVRPEEPVVRGSNERPPEGRLPRVRKNEEHLRPCSGEEEASEEEQQERKGGRKRLTS